MEEFFSFTLIEQLGWPAILLICGVALITSSIHGATGVAGGFLLSAAIAPIIGVKPIVPVISVALLISHTTRALLNARDFDRKAFLFVAVPAFPGIVEVAEYLGSDTFLYINAGALGTIVVRTNDVGAEIKGQEVYLHFNQGRLYFFGSDEQVIT